MTIQEWLEDTTRKFKKSAITSARLDALVLLEYILVTPRATILSHSETDLPATTLIRLENALQQRISGIPLAYIMNKKEFYGREFIVNEHVLIPRPETENIIEVIKSLQFETPRIADIGTGSGCIAITLAIEVPDSRVTAIDISNKALNIAKQNAKYLGAQVTFKHSDLFNNISERRFDIVCANLPYVPVGHITSKEITKEPHLALFSGKDGLGHYRRFFIEVAELINKPIYILTEALESQLSTMEELANLSGYTLVQTNDLVQLFKLKN